MKKTSHPFLVDVIARIRCVPPDGITRIRLYIRCFGIHTCVLLYHPAISVFLSFSSAKPGQMENKDEKIERHHLVVYIDA